MSFDFKNASKEDFDAKMSEISKESGDLKFFSKKEMRYLPEVLKEGEQVLALSSGIMDNNTWLISLTNERVIFLDKGMITGLSQTVIPLEKVNSISGKQGWVLGSITITDGAQNYKIDSVAKKSVPIFTNKVQKAIDDLKEKATQPAATPANDSRDKVAELEKLAGLMEKGILTQEEFQSEKQKILAL